MRLSDPGVIARLENCHNMRGLRDQDRKAMQQREQQCELQREGARLEVVGPQAQQGLEAQKTQAPEMSDVKFYDTVREELFCRVRRPDTPLWGDTDEYRDAYNWHKSLVRHTVSAAAAAAGH